MASKQTDITENGAVDLDERALDDVAGGFEAFPKAWKVNGFDGKGNDVVTEEIVFVAERVKKD